MRSHRLSEVGLPPLPPLVHKSVVGLPVVSAGVAVTRDSSVVVPFRDHRGKRKREGGGDVKSSRREGAPLME